MIKNLLLAMTLMMTVAAYAADAAPVPAAGPAPADAKNSDSPAPPLPKKTAPENTKPPKSQHQKARDLRAVCNKLADSKRLSGQTRKIYVAKCEKGA